MTKRKRITRKGTDHTVFGQADPLPAHKLPLYGEVLKNFFLLIADNLVYFFSRTMFIQYIINFLSKKKKIISHVVEVLF